MRILLKRFRKIFHKYTGFRRILKLSQSLIRGFQRVKKNVKLPAYRAGLTGHVLAAIEAWLQRMTHFFFRAEVLRSTLRTTQA